MRGHRVARAKAAALAAALAFAPAAARAGSSGFIFGGSVGLGVGGRSVCSGSGCTPWEWSPSGTALNPEVGWRFTPKVALVGYVPTRFQYEGRNSPRGVGGPQVAVRLSFAERWWARFGLGLGIEGPAFWAVRWPDPDFDYGVLGSAAVGVDFARAGPVSFFLELRLLAGALVGPGRSEPRSGVDLLLGVGKF